jgi:hypothetical protein
LGADCGVQRGVPKLIAMHAAGRYIVHPARFRSRQRHELLLRCLALAIHCRHSCLSLTAYTRRPMKNHQPAAVTKQTDVKIQNKRTQSGIVMCEYFNNANLNTIKNSRIAAPTAIQAAAPNLQHAQQEQAIPCTANSMRFSQIRWTKSLHKMDLSCAITSEAHRRRERLAYAGRGMQASRSGTGVPVH